MLVDSSKVLIDLDIISNNLSAIKSLSPHQKLMAIIKADAYGHGAVEVGRHIENDCDFFGVSSVAEALELRHGGIQLPILILGTTPPASFEEVIRNRIRPAIYRWEDGLSFSKAAVSMGVCAPFHFALDTGMSRIGFQATEKDADEAARIAALPNLIAEGLFSHYATADCKDLQRAKYQADQFHAFDSMLRERNVNIPLRHLNNSAGIMNFQGDYEMVRSGIITYGMYPSDEVDPNKLIIQPAMRWLSTITHVKTLEPGREIGYGGTYTVRQTMRVATIPVGYADGYRRNLSNRFYVIIRGQKAPIVGRVCMDQMMVDVTEIPEARVDDTVTLIGQDGDLCITIEDIAKAADSFNYEFSCAVSRRVPRIYLRNGAISKAVHYLLP